MAARKSATEEAVTHAVRILLTHHGLKQEDLAGALKVSPDTISRRVNAGGWTLAEVDGLARLFGVSVADLVMDTVDLRESKLAEPYPRSNRPSRVTRRSPDLRWSRAVPAVVRTGLLCAA